MIITFGDQTVSYEMTARRPVFLNSTKSSLLVDNYINVIDDSNLLMTLIRNVHAKTLEVSTRGKW